MIWDNILKTYETYESNPGICPIAHTYITVNIAVLLSQDGRFLSALAVPGKELAIVPCTWKSEARTSGSAPHLLSDNLSYLTGAYSFRGRHEKYLEQLGDYVEAVPDDLFASSVYRYISGETILGDIGDILEKHWPKMQPQHVYVVFAVYGIATIDRKWTEYHLSALPPNGICAVTGEPDFIPDTYPAGICNTNDMARLFVSGCGVGYVASQKIIHTLQYLAYGKKMMEAVE